MNIKLATNKFNIDENDNGMRLDNFLIKSIKGLPQKKIYSMIRKGEIRVNSKYFLVNFLTNKEISKREGFRPVRGTC